MKINLFKEYTNCIKKPISEDEVEMAMNLGNVILNKKLSAHEWNVGLMGGEEMSEAEFLDPLVEIPTPQEGWLERLRLRKNIVPTWCAVHKAYACDLPEGEYQGNNDENGGQIVYKAWRYAQARNMKVKAQILGLDFYVTPDMSEEEAGLCAQAAIVNHGAKMERIAAKETLDVTGHRQIWEKNKKESPKDAEYAERLGTLIQAEMKASGEDFAPIMFMRMATFQDQIHGDGGAHHPNAGRMLFSYWKHGIALAKACGRDIKELRKERWRTMDISSKHGNDGPQV